MSKKVEYDYIEFDGLEYKTHFTKKFINRKKWEGFSPGIITTAIPGLILDICVKEGQEVEKGDLLCLLEAMKMHNKILAPVAGTIKKIHMNKGDKLPKDTIMFEIE